MCCMRPLSDIISYGGGGSGGGVHHPQVVGQPRWSGSGEEFKARLVIKLEEAAIGR